jgi:hypothetical protein
MGTLTFAAPGGTRTTAGTAFATTPVTEHTFIGGGVPVQVCAVRGAENINNARSRIQIRHRRWDTNALITGTLLAAAPRLNLRPLDGRARAGDLEN